MGTLVFVSMLFLNVCIPALGYAAGNEPKAVKRKDSVCYLKQVRFGNEEKRMQYKVKVTVLDKKLYPELQQEYCAVPDSGKCPCYYVGDEFLFYRNDERDDFWHMGAGTLVKSGQPDEGCLQSPGTMHCGTKGVPFCSEAWDAISRYIYTALQGGSIMHGWTKDDKVMIACCNDGTRPVIFKIERIDYE